MKFIVAAVIIVSSLATLGCSSVKKHPAVILWSESQNGLSLVIEQPRAAFVFIPVKDCEGPVIVGRDGGPPTVNAGGYWSKAAVVRVFIKNTSDHVIWWSAEHGANAGEWSVRVSKPGVPQPTHFDFSMPAPLRPGPIPLAPAERKELDFDLNDAGGFWPLIPAGKYTVTVTYSPNALLKFGRGGGEGHWTHPYDVPGFWKGIIATPELHVAVAYP
jgi:hypothetical protein